MSEQTLRQRLAALHAERVATWDPETLQININQRARLVVEATERRWVRPGEVAPQFVLHEVDGGTLRLGEMLKAGPLVLVFFRFAGCPACNIAIPYYRDHLAPGLQNLGATLVAVSPQVPEKLVEIKRRHDLPFAVASDPGSTLGRHLGILYSFDEASRAASLAKGRGIGETTGTGTWELPMPAVVVVDQRQVVRFVDVSPDWLVRTEAKDVLAAVRAIVDSDALAAA